MIDNKLILKLLIFLLVVVLLQFIFLFNVKSPNLPQNSWYNPGKDICVVMIITPNIDNDYSKCVLINQEFCRKFNYGFLVQRASNSDRHIVWDRVLLLKKALEMGYQYAFYIDADAYFTHKLLRTSGNLKYLVKKMVPNNKLIGMFGDFPFDKSKGCAGVICIKNSPISKEFLEEWWHAFYSTCKDIQDKFPREQGCMWRLRKSPKYQTYFNNINLLEGGYYPIISKYIVHLKIGRVYFFNDFYIYLSKLVQKICINKEYLRYFYGN